MSVPLSQAIVEDGGPQPPWTEAILSIVGWGFLLPIITMRLTLWLGPLNLILLAKSGSFHRTMKVTTENAKYYFSVPDIAEWLDDCEAQAKEHNMGLPVRRKQGDNP